jgi:hypothetical protein
MPAKPDRSLFWLGKYLSLALTLPAGAAGGYFVGSWADHILHVSFCSVLGILLGIAGGLIHVFQELTREAKALDPQAGTGDGLPIGKPRGHRR